MDPAGFEAVVPSGVSSEKSLASVGDKRPAENEDDIDSGGRLHKKVRKDLNTDMKKVAEIVLVLSAMGKMRGGRNPTNVEKRLMEEARQKLAEMCDALAPKDIIPRDAVNAVIEDLGLNNRSKDQRLGFRPPKMSIAETLLLTKRKMEESKAFAGQSGTYSSRLPQVGFGATVGSRVTLSQSTHMFPPEKPCPTPVSVGVFQPAPHTVHVSPLSSTSSVNQLPVNEVQPSVVSRGLSGSSLEKDSSSLSLPRTEAAHFRLDGRLNGPAFASQVQANTSGGHQSEETVTFSLQPQPFAVARLGQTVQGLDVTPIKSDGSSNISSSQVSIQAAKDQSSKPSVIQTASGSLPSVHQPSQGMNFIQNPSPYDNHNDIARNVQKFLQPRHPEHPNWNPPSVEYMNKALTCQICKATISDVESLLVCDACEKGVHLKCLQSYNQKGIPKGEWHCPKCMVSSNGKPLPPKYGRVTRNITGSKVPSSINGGLISPEKKVGNSDQKNNQKAVANGNLGLVNPAGAGNTGSNHVESVPELKISSVREAHGPDFTVSRISPEKSRETAGVACAPLSGTVNDGACNPPIQSSGSSSCDTGGSNSEFKSLPKFDQGQHCPAKSYDTDINSGFHIQTSCNSLDADKKGLLNHEASGNQDLGNISTKELEKSDIREAFEPKSGDEIRQEKQDFIQAGSMQVSDVGNGSRDCNMSSLDDLNSVDWVGDIARVVDEKSFYQSCCVNGVVYKLEDHALFCSNNDSLRPSKLQALWEDNKTRTKWAIVNRCYLPGDLPEVVGRPCTPEKNEVYESNHNSTVMAGLIQGPCQVLPPNKFKEESERRSHLPHGTNDGLQPVFLCKWFYDESKGLFRAVTD